MGNGLLIKRISYGVVGVEKHVFARGREMPVFRHVQMIDAAR